MVGADARNAESLMHSEPPATHASISLLVDALRYRGREYWVRAFRDGSQNFPQATDGDAARSEKNVGGHTFA